MKCENCNYGEDILEPTHSGSIKCKITGEEHINTFECNCDFTRTRRDKEARLLKEKAAALESLENLKNRITKPSVDAQYIIDILTDSTSDVTTNIAKAIDYLKEFL